MGGVSYGGCDLEDKISRRECKVSLLAEVVVRESRDLGRTSVVEERVLLVEQLVVLQQTLEGSEALQISTATMAEIVSG